MAEPLPLSSLAPAIRDRLESLAAEWLGFDPWQSALYDCGWDGDCREPILPLDFGAGFDLGVRLYAECQHVSVADVHSDLRDDPMRIGVETPADRQPEARLRVMLLDLGRGDARALAADLVRAADAVEPMVERSCYTCAHDFKASTGRHTCRTSVNIGGYINAAGLDNSPDGMPTDRSIPCPGHAREVTS